MFLYVFTGFGLLCGGVYLFKPRLFYKGVINVSITVIRNMLWLKQLKRKYLDEPNQLLHNKELEIDDIKVHEFTYRTTNFENNYTYNYVLKYIVDNNLEGDIENEKNHTEKVKKNIKNKLNDITNIEILEEKINKILHCSFYWDEDPETVVELTSDLRHFVLHFDCEETTIYKFLKYANQNYDLNLNIYDADKCGLSIIKNDDIFSETRISLNNSKFISFKEVFKF